MSRRLEREKLGAPFPGRDIADAFEPPVGQLVSQDASDTFSVSLRDWISQESRGQIGMCKRTAYLAPREFTAVHGPSPTGTASERCLINSRRHSLLLF